MRKLISYNDGNVGANGERVENAPLAVSIGSLFKIEKTKGVLKVTKKK